MGQADDIELRNKVAEPLPPEAVAAGVGAILDFLDGHSTVAAISQQAAVLARKVFVAMAAHLRDQGVLGDLSDAKETPPDKSNHEREP